MAFVEVNGYKYDERDVHHRKDGTVLIEGGDWWYEGEPCAARQENPELHPMSCSAWNSHNGLCYVCADKLIEWMKSGIPSTVDSMTVAENLDIVLQKLHEFPSVSKRNT